MKQIAVVILLAMSIFGNTKDFNWTNSTKNIKNFGLYIEKVYSSCEPINGIGRKLPCGRFYRPVLDSFIHNTKNTVTADSLDIIESFSALYIDYKGIESKKGMLVDDDTLINIAISMLTDTNKNHIKIAENGLKLLLNFTYYSNLKRHQHEIQNAIRTASIDNSNKILLMYLSGSPTSECKSLSDSLKLTKLPLYCLQDKELKEAIDSTLKIIQKPESFENKKRAVIELLMLNNPEVNKRLIVELGKHNDINMITNNNCIEESIWYPFINELNKWHPEVEILRKYDEYFPPLSRNNYDTSIVKKYMNNLFNWLEITYKLKTDEMPMIPIRLKGKCIDSIRKTY